MDLGSMVREWILQHELSYEELANQANLSTNTIRHLAEGITRKPRARTIARLARVLGRDPKEFQSLLTKEVSHVSR